MEIAIIVDHYLIIYLNGIKSWLPRARIFLEYSKSYIDIVRSALIFGCGSWYCFVEILRTSAPYWSIYILYREDSLKYCKLAKGVSVVAFACTMDEVPPRSANPCIPTESVKWYLIKELDCPSVFSQKLSIQAKYLIIKLSPIFSIKVEYVAHVMTRLFIANHFTSSLLYS